MRRIVPVRDEPLQQLRIGYRLQLGTSGALAQKLENPGDGH